MTEVIHHETDSSSNSLLAVVLVLVIAIGGFLLWRYAGNSEPKEEGAINIELTAPSGNNEPAAN